MHVLSVVLGVAGGVLCGDRPIVKAIFFLHLFDELILIFIEMIDSVAIAIGSNR